MAEARNRDLRLVSEAQSALASAAARPDALQAVLHQLAVRTGSWTVLLDAAGQELFAAGERPAAPAPRQVRELAARTTARLAGGPAGRRRRRPPPSTSKDATSPFTPCPAASPSASPRTPRPAASTARSPASPPSCSPCSPAPGTPSAPTPAVPAPSSGCCSAQPRPRSPPCCNRTAPRTAAGSSSPDGAPGPDAGTTPSRSRRSAPPSARPTWTSPATNCGPSSPGPPRPIRPPPSGWAGRSASAPPPGRTGSGTRPCTPTAPCDGRWRAAGAPRSSATKP
ncbi:hypothetical protein ACFQ1I_34070 [Kitasatospora arboriphila]